MKNYTTLLSVLIDADQTTGLRSDGKIYVVILVVALIFLGILLYLSSIDLRVRKLEKKD